MKKSEIRLGFYDFQFSNVFQHFPALSNIFRAFCSISNIFKQFPAFSNIFQHFRAFSHFLVFSIIFQVFCNHFPTFSDIFQHFQHFPTFSNIFQHFPKFSNIPLAFSNIFKHFPIFQRHPAHAAHPVNYSSEFVELFVDGQLALASWSSGQAPLDAFKFGSPTAAH